MQVIAIATSQYSSPKMRGRKTSRMRKIQKPQRVLPPARLVAPYWVELCDGLQALALWRFRAWALLSRLVPSWVGLSAEELGAQSGELQAGWSGWASQNMKLRDMKAA